VAADRLVGAVGLDADGWYAGLALLHAVLQQTTSGLFNIYSLFRSIFQVPSKALWPMASVGIRHIPSKLGSSPANSGFSW
jgi:hypothetical protein